MDFKLSSIIKAAVNVCFVIMLIIAVFNIVNLNEQNETLISDNETLNATIAANENTINELTQGNKTLNENVLSVKSENANLQVENNKLQENNNALASQIQELIAQIEKLEAKKVEEEKEEGKVTQPITPPKRDFKSFMSYKAITSKSSKQWQLQQEAITNEDGIRCIDGIPLVAIGTGWGLSVGDIAMVACENGNSFKIMVGDIKSDKHTDAEHKTSGSGCRCEFIVDISKLNSKVKVMGNMSTLPKYSGYVVDITKVN